MKFCVLASGSKGNCTYIETEHHKCLIDVGMNFLYTSTKLREIGVEPDEIDSIFITHTHKDHTYGLKRFLKMCRPKVYLTPSMYHDIEYVISDYEFIQDGIVLDELSVESIKLSHDTDDINGYIFTCLEKSVVYITDTGYIHVKNHDRLKNRNYYIMESNHDIDMLMKGKYPYPIKMRILGDRGHLSNKDSSYYLSHFIGDNTKGIVLAHLSEENNTPDLARNHLEQVLVDKGKHVGMIVLATQEDRTDVIEV